METNICPFCKEEIKGNKKIYANHIRWCEKNPEYKKIRLSTINKLKTHKTKEEFIVKCEICGKEYSVICTKNAFNKGKYKHTCCNYCAKKLTAAHTDIKEKNKKISIKLNRQIKYTKICPYCGKEYITTRKNQVFCCKSCSMKNRYKNRSDYEIYKSKCDFNFSLNDYPEEFDFSLIEKYGWYKAKNHGDNPEGVSRDHKYSINEGYKNNISPDIISHPANCRLILQKDNASKNSKCCITIDELIEQINKWNIKYNSQL